MGFSKMVQQDGVWVLSGAQRCSPAGKEGNQEGYWERLEGSAVEVSVKLKQGQESEMGGATERVVSAAWRSGGDGKGWGEVTSRCPSGGRSKNQWR